MDAGADICVVSVHKMGAGFEQGSVFHMDVSETGATGYEIADWLREHRLLDLGHSDHRRILATLSMSDDKHSLDTLHDALAAWRVQCEDPKPHGIRRTRNCGPCAWSHAMPAIRRTVNEHEHPCHRTVSVANDGVGGGQYRQIEEIK